MRLEAVLRELRLSGEKSPYQYWVAVVLVLLWLLEELLEELLKQPFWLLMLFLLPIS